MANQAAIDIAGVTTETPFSGGYILQKDGALTGIFIDNPMALIRAHIPEESKSTHISALLDAQRICFGYGLTTVNDAGVSPSTIALMDSLQLAGELKMRIYAMVSGSEENLDYYLEKGIHKTDRLNVRSFKTVSYTHLTLPTIYSV